MVAMTGKELLEALQAMSPEDLERDVVDALDGLELTRISVGLPGDWATSPPLVLHFDTGDPDDVL